MRKVITLMLGVICLVLLLTDGAASTADAQAVGKPPMCLETYYIPNRPGPPIRIVTNVTSGKQIIYSEGGRLSPDGRKSAFVDYDGVLTIEDVTTNQVPTISGQAGLSTTQRWSADSRYVTTQTQDGDDNMVLKVYNTTDPLPVLTIPTRVPNRFGILNVSIAAWSPVGDQIAYFTLSADDALILNIGTLDKSTPRSFVVKQQMKADLPAIDVPPTIKILWSPDGHTVAAIYWGASESIIQLYSGNGQRLIWQDRHPQPSSYPFPAQFLTWGLDSRTLYYLWPGARSTGLSAYSLADGRPRVLSANVASTAFSPDVKQVLVQPKDSDKTAASLINLTTGKFFALPHDAGLDDSPGVYWSPDSTSFVRIFHEESVLWMKVDGTYEEILPTGRSLLGFAGEGPFMDDGQYIMGYEYVLGDWLTFYEQGSDSQLEYIDFLNLRTHVHLEYAATPAKETVLIGLISADGKRFTLNGRDPDTGKWKTDLLAFDGTTPRLIKTLPDSGWSYLWSPDAPILAYLGYDSQSGGHSIVIADEDGKQIRIFALPDGGFDGPTFEWIPCPRSLVT